MNLDCTENGVVKLDTTTNATIHKAYDAFGLCGVGGLRAGSATKFFKTHVITRQDICEMKCI